jgi:hypothetical protein
MRAFGSEKGVGATSQVSPRGRTLVFRYVVFLALVSLASMTLVSKAVAAAPAMRLRAITQPTHFVPGSAPAEGILYPGAESIPAYGVIATNVGTAPTSGNLIFTATVPSALTIGAVPPEIWAKVNKEPIPCSVSGQRVTCVDPAVLQPGQWAQMFIPVGVPVGASGTVTARFGLEGGGAPSTSTSIDTSLIAALPSFGLLEGRSGLAAALTPADALPSIAVQAGSHPAGMMVELGLPTREAGEGGGTLLEPGITAVEDLRDARVDLPRGMVVDPTATPVRCTEGQLENRECPEASAIGTVAVLTNLLTVAPQLAPLYNMVPPPGSASDFGFDAIGQGIFVHILGGVRPDGGYVLSAHSSDILARPTNPILGLQVELWGDPSSSSYEWVRGSCATRQVSLTAPCPTPSRGEALLTAPTACSAGLGISASVDSWQQPGRRVEAPGSLEALGGIPLAISGCGRLDFSPRLSVTPQVRTADSPSGLDVDLHVPQDDSLNTLAEANLKDAVVTLPPGLVLNPSSANGLAACTAAQFALEGGEPANCPDASKIGTVEVDTPLLEHPLPGAIYVAKPYENPFGSLLAIYVMVYDPETGVVIKLAGHVEADPTTGRLTTTFANNPQLPFEDFKLEFFGGPRAVLRTPTTCGTFSSQSRLTPWSGTAAVEEGSPFTVAAGADGGACVSNEVQLPDRPSFEAGTANPLAGTFSPFVLHLKREDGSQQFRGLNVELPLGLLGKLARIPYCPDSALTAAEARSGHEEQATPSCPAASEVGKMTVGAGAGPQPYYVSGRAYLAGPYRGAPLSLVIITPAVAGPYDLGTVVVRSALYVNETTAQITVKSDPIPTILKGIPLDVRSISVEMDRPDFTLNPTSCDPASVSGEAITTAGQTAPLSNRFQVGGCRGLDFKPNLKVQLKGATKRIGHPALKAVLTAKAGEANIGRAQVNLPHGEFLDQGNLNKTCTKPILLAGRCSKSTIYGKAKAWTPLLDEPLQGPVYLVGGYGYKLPALVADLNGQIRILLVGKIDSGRNKGIRSTFESVPDAPVSRFVLEMKGGKKYGLLENAENLCKAPKAKRRAIVRFTGHNGMVDQYKPMVRNQCGKSAKKKGHHG